MKVSVYLLVIVAATCYSIEMSEGVKQAPTNTMPIVYIPGLGSSCFIDGISSFYKEIKNKNPYGNKMYCIDPAPSVFSILTSIKYQAKRACELINKRVEEWKLDQGFIILGSSQGNLLGRYILQNCEAGKYVKRYISSGGPHMGVMRVPRTGYGFFGKIINGVVEDFVYNPLIQRMIGPAGYFKSLSKYETYLKNSIFLPDLNNERSFNQQYKDRMSQLEALVLVKYTKDHVIYPNESEHFGYYADSTQTTMVKMEDTDTYKNDTLGLRELNESGRIFFYDSPHDHLGMTIEEVHEFIFPHCAP